jgi:hypothetical protein
LNFHLLRERFARFLNSVMSIKTSAAFELSPPHWHCGRKVLLACFERGAKEAFLAGAPSAGRGNAGKLATIPLAH